MSTYVLVHGAWHGSWCWNRVRKILEERGHEVYTPTLTGLAERSHLLSPEVNLETHSQDVLNLVQWDGGHSRWRAATMQCWMSPRTSQEF